MDRLAQILGYAVMVLTSVAAVSALALWAVDLVLTNTKTKLEVFKWYVEKIRKQRDEREAA